MTDDTITCPYCKSDQWKCYNEQTELFEDKNVSQDDKNRYFEMPVGYMKCLDCGKAYVHWNDMPNIVWIGRWDD